MKILITGTTGYVGSNLLLKYSSYSNNLLSWGKTSVYQEIYDFRPDVIFHSAAEIYNEEKMFDSNIKLTYDLLKIAAKIKTKAFIYIGSSSEYGIKSISLSEQEILEPITLYGATKAAGSLLTSVAKIPSIIARPFSLYGKNEPLHRLIPKIYDSIKNNTPITIYSGVHDFIYIDDFIDGLDLCMNQLLTKKVYKDILNFGTGHQYTNLEVVNLFEEILQNKLNYKIKNSLLKEYDSLNWRNNTTYTENKYGYKTKINLKKGLEKYIQYRETTPKENIRY